MLETKTSSIFNRFYLGEAIVYQGFYSQVVHADIFDRFYTRKGLGFEQEKNLQTKTSKNVLPIGGI
jgi:hypothetical protein